MGGALGDDRRLCFVHALQEEAHLDEQIASVEEKLRAEREALALLEEQKRK